MRHFMGAFILKNRHFNLRKNHYFISFMLT